MAKMKKKDEKCIFLRKKCENICRNEKKAVPLHTISINYIVNNNNYYL